MKQTLVHDDRMHDCKGVRFDPKALDIISDIIGRLRRGGSGDCLCPQEDWLNEIPVHEPIQLNRDVVRAQEDMATARSIDNVAKPLKLAVDVLQKILKCISHQVDDCTSAARALRMRAGFAYLPDEVLSSALEYALMEKSSPIGARGEYRSSILRTVRAIGRLSLTCRRFRYILMDLSNAWCRLWDGMNSSLVSALSKRLNRPVAEILISSNAGNDGEGSKFQLFINAVVARAGLWTRFTFDLDDFGDVATFQSKIRYLARSTHRLHVPFLTHLTVESPRETLHGGLKEDDEHYYFSSWSTPRLTSFAVRNLVPYPLAASSTLTSFEISLQCPPVRERTLGILKALTLFLASCSNLLVFKMVLFSESLDSSADNIIANQPIILPKVEALAFHFSHCEASLIKSFFDIVKLPSASSMSLLMAIIPRDTDESSPFQDVLSTIFYPRPTQKSSLSLLRNLDLQLISFSTRHRVTLPYASLRNLEHLTVSLRDVTFEDSPLPLDSEPCMPALRSLTFESCRYLERTWVRRLLEKLKRQGNVPRLSASDSYWNEENIDGSGHLYGVRVDDLLLMVS